MSSSNSPQPDLTNLTLPANVTVGIIYTEWYPDIMQSLLNGAIKTLNAAGIKEERILTERVPGSFELPLGANILAEKNNPDGIICLGCVIKGETPHFDYVCQGVTQGIMTLNLELGIPVIFGVLTTLNHQQALERSGLSENASNKGEESAFALLKMIHLRNK